MNPQPSLLRQRLESGFSQDDVAAALGVSRAMVSYWESGRREPSGEQLAELQRLFGTPRQQRHLLDAVLLRTMEAECGENAAAGLKEWIRVLDGYADLSKALDQRLDLCFESPFSPPRASQDLSEVRRKVEEVRAHLRLGVGPITDMDAVCDLLRVHVFYEPLGADLRQTISGAFLRHPRLGLTVLVNLEMTPGRRRFTVAHELAHALFHSRDEAYILSSGGGARERWADSFAGEFLMPVEGIRRLMDDLAIDLITDASEVVHLQRFFRVSYATALVRLRAAGLLSPDQFSEFRELQPVRLAQAMGYSIEEDEHVQLAVRWGLAKLPANLRRLLRHGLTVQAITTAEASRMFGVDAKDLKRLVATTPTGDLNNKELDEYAASGTLPPLRN